MVIMSAYASFFASIIACNVATEVVPHSPSGKPLTMLSIIRAAMPLLVGRHLVDGPSRGSPVEIGLTHSAVESPQGRSAAMVPPSLFRRIENALASVPL